MILTERPARVTPVAALLGWRWRDQTARDAMLILVASATLAASGHTGAATAGERQEQEGDDGVADATVRVVFETDRGHVEIAIETAHASISAANFLANVDASHYDGATFYRAAAKTTPGTIGIVQGGLLVAAMSGSRPYLGDPSSPYPPVAHETTQTTGIPNMRGTLALARLEPGTASSEFFFNLSDNPELETDAGIPGRDGYGYATLGRVRRGIEVLDAIGALPADGATTIEQVQGQVLRNPVEIRRAYRAR